jgi:hypothetical protein
MFGKTREARMHSVDRVRVRGDAQPLRVGPGWEGVQQSAPVIKLPEGASEDEHLGLLGLLNSSTACFWMKQVFHNKGKDGRWTAANVDEPWEHGYEFDGTKLKQFPLPEASSVDVRGADDGWRQQLSEALPTAVAERAAPTAETLESLASRSRGAAGADGGVAGGAGLGVLPALRAGGRGPDVPTDGAAGAVEKGQRAFEIVLARKVAAGEVETSWFERHGSTPITELPDHWPDAYRQVVERRIELIELDRTSGCGAAGVQAAVELGAVREARAGGAAEWLLDRLEAPELWGRCR